MRTVRLIIVALALAVVAPLVAAERAAETFLFVVDTSFSMAAQKQTLHAAVHDLIDTGVNGAMKPGDKISIWTFNRETNTRRFTPLEWRPERRTAIATTAVAFLKEQTFTKISRLDLAMVEIVNSLEDRAPFTVLLFSDGFEFVWGTTFDAQINRVYREHAAEVRREGKSFVTMLRALDGVFVSSGVSILGDALRLPELPAVSPMAQPAANTPEPKPAPVMVIPPPKQIAAAPVTKSPLPVASTNAPANPPPRNQPETKPSVTPAPGIEKVIAKDAVVIQPAPESKPIVKAETPADPKNDSPAKSAPGKADVAVTKTDLTPKPLETPPAAAPAPLTPTKPSLPEKAAPALPDTKTIRADATGKIAVPPPSVQPSVPAPASTPPIAVPTPTRVPESTPAQFNDLPVPGATPPGNSPANTLPASEPATSSVSPAKTASTLAETAMLPPPPAEPNRLGYLLIGCAGLLTLVWLGYFFLTRRSSEPTSSYITRSLDRRRK